MKKSFILYLDQYEPIKSLTDSQKGILFENLFKHHLGEELNLDDQLINMALGFFKQTFKRDDKKYENICDRNRTNGLKGGRPKNPENPVGSLVSQDNPEKPKKADSDSVSDNESDKPILSRNGIPYKEIIEYLNKKAATNYKHTTKETQRCIKARFSSGFTLDDFKTVMDKKVKWLEDEKFCEYYRPPTLFGTKFESYLNEGTKKEKSFAEEYGDW